MNSVKDCAAAIETLQNDLKEIKVMVEALDELMQSMNPDSDVFGKMVNRIEALEYTVAENVKGMANLSAAIEDTESRINSTPTVAPPRDTNTFVPSWLYGPTGGSMLVKSKTEFDRLLSDGWTESPGKNSGHTVRAKDDSKAL